MVVLITWSTTSGGESIAEPVSHGNISNGGAGPTIDLYIRHDATADPITDVGFFIQPYSGTGYTGAGEQADYLEILGWGVDPSPTLDGGFYINQDLVGGFLDANWMVHKSGQGDSSNPIDLDADCIVGVGGTDGEIPVDGEAHIRVKLVVPADEDTAGIRFFDQVLAYTFTS